MLWQVSPPSRRQSAVPRPLGANVWSGALMAAAAANVGGWRRSVFCSRMCVWHATQRNRARARAVPRHSVYVSVVTIIYQYCITVQCMFGIENAFDFGNLGKVPLLGFWSDRHET